MRALRPLLTLFLLLLLTLGAGVAYLLTIDPTRFLPQVQAAVLAATGRALTVSGPVRLVPAPRPILIVEGLALANVPGGSEPVMLHVRRAEITPDLYALLRGVLGARRIRAVGVRLLVERPEGGRWNWSFATASGGAPAVMPDLREVRVDDLRIRLAGLEREHTAVVERLTLRRADGSPPLTVRALATVRGQPLEVSGRIGDLGALAGAEPFPFDLALRADTLVARAHGRARMEGGGEVELSLKTPDAALLGALTGYGLPPGLALEAHARVEGDRVRARVPSYAIEVGASAARGALQIDASGPRPRIEGSVEAARLDIDELIAALGAPPAGEPPRGPMFASERFALPGPVDAEVVLTASAAEIIAGGLRAHGVDATVRVDGRTLAVEPLSAEIAGGRVQASAALDAADGSGLAARVKLEGQGLRIESLLEALGAAPALEGAAQVKLDLSARGDSAAAMAGGLEGTARVLVGRGRVRAAGLDAAVGGVRALGGAMGEGAAWTPLNCLAADLGVRAGVATPRTLALDTENALVRGEGIVDLGRERVDLAFTPSPKGATLNMAVPVRVTGTLREPALTPDPAGTARRVGGLAGSLLFPPALLLAFADLGGDEGGCAGRTTAATPAAEARPPAASGGFLDRLRGLFGSAPAETGSRPAVEDRR